MNLFTGNPLLVIGRALQDKKLSLRIIGAGTVATIMIGSVLSFMFYGIEVKIGQALLFLSTISLLALDTIFRNQDREKLEQRIDRAEQQIQENPNKAHPLWDAATGKLELYFERNLSQVKSIFWFTIIVMTAGFALIAFGVTKAIGTPDQSGSGLAVLSGILTEFIGASFLVIFKSTMQQAGDYVKTLERINAVGMSIQIVDQIPDDDLKLKNEVRAKLASDLLSSFAISGSDHSAKNK